jgi:hypothetical protein
MAEIRISKDVLAQELEGETVILDLASESYFGLNEVGTRIWALVEEGQSREAVVDTLVDEYDVERDVLEKDVSELLDQLNEAGLIEFA